MINSIESKTLWTSKQTGFPYFHPRPCMFSDQGNNKIFMTMQKISGSDTFHDVQYTISSDHGTSWSTPENIPDLGWKPFYEDVYEGVCDVAPDYHPQTGTILAMGHNVYYQNDKLLDTAGTWNKDNIGYKMNFKRGPVYSIRKSDGTWLTRKKLELADFEACNTASAFGQKVLLNNGNILLPITFGVKEIPARKVCSVECSYNGEELKVLQKGNDLELQVGRGLLEPSMIKFRDKYYMTLRAEDNHGYLCVSDDGLNWGEINPWCWDSGEELTMSTTQQHWLIHSGNLYLVYTRKDECNTKVMRWRSPLYIAQVAPEKMQLIEETERVVLPIVGDGNAEPANVPLMGNFHTLSITDTLSAVTVGENCYYDKFSSGDVLCALIK